jgi:hypothetical protein
VTTYGVFHGGRLRGAYRSRERALQLVAELLAPAWSDEPVDLSVFERGLLVRKLAGEELRAEAATFGTRGEWAGEPWTCDRCTRAPRCGDDALSWVVIGSRHESIVCPQCLTDDERRHVHAPDA